MEHKILIYPDERLRQKSEAVVLNEIPTLSSLTKEMISIMKRASGVGLAAPQIGVGKRIIVVMDEEPWALFNPKIIKKSRWKEIDEEGCLSVPNVYGYVKRYKSIMVCANIETGEKMSFFFSGLLARVVQHEIDHLDGILFIDKAKKIKKIER